MFILIIYKSNIIKNIRLVRNSQGEFHVKQSQRFIQKKGQ